MGGWRTGGSSSGGGSLQPWGSPCNEPLAHLFIISTLLLTPSSGLPCVGPGQRTTPRWRKYQAKVVGNSLKIVELIRPFRILGWTLYCFTWSGHFDYVRSLLRIVLCCYIRFPKQQEEWSTKFIFDICYLYNPKLFCATYNHAHCHVLLSLPIPAGSHPVYIFSNGIP